MQNPDTAVRYRVRLPETASVSYTAIYGLWAVFVSCCALWLAVMMLLPPKSNAITITLSERLAMLIVPLMLGAYSIWVWRKLITQWRNRSLKAQLLNQIGTQPIPARSDYADSFAWQSFAARIRLYRVTVLPCR